MQAHTVPSFHILRPPPSVKVSECLEPRILIIDDDLATVQRLRALLGENGYADVQLVTNPLFGRVQCCEMEPDVVILDPLPSLRRGHDIMRDLVDLTSDGFFLPILALTEDESTVGKHEAFYRGACDYFTKPFDACRLLRRVRQLTQMTALGRVHRRMVKGSEGQLEASVSAWHNMCAAAINRECQGGQVIDCSDTGTHSTRVAVLSAQLAQAMGLAHDFLSHLREGALIHDIGKIAIPDEILFKPRHLSAGEFELTKRHAFIGSRILAPANTLQMQVAQSIARSHHERWDGTGYPVGLRCEEIPLQARIIAVADAYDSMTSDRVYRNAVPPSQALEKVREQIGRQFDPGVVEVLLDLFAASPED